jgi:hypothetical protein
MVARAGLEPALRPERSPLPGARAMAADERVDRSREASKAPLLAGGSAVGWCSLTVTIRRCLIESQVACRRSLAAGALCRADAVQINPHGMFHDSRCAMRRWRSGSAAPDLHVSGVDSQIEPIALPQRPR